MADVDALPPATQEMLLKELRDLQMPEPLSWWPPAPGWWVVAALVAVALAYAVIRLLRYREATRYRREARYAFGELHQQWTTTKDGGAYLNGAAAVLRQVAIKARGREHVAGLTGSAWIDELSTLSTAALSSATTTALTATRYRGSDSADVGNVHGELLNWLSKLKAVADV